MYAKAVIFLSLCVFSVYSKGLPLPSYLKPCQRKSPDFQQCALRHGRDAIRDLVKGDRKYNIPPLAPLVIPSVELSTDEQFKLNVVDLHVNNLDNVDLQKINIDFEKKKESYLQLYFDYVNLIGKYDVNGRILILPIQGKGNANATAEGLTVVYKFDLKVENKDGEDYVVCEDATADFTVKRASFYLSNLFNGNEQLGESTNKVLNEEWEKFLEALKPSINTLIVKIANGIVESITARVPYSEFFPE